MKVDSWQNIIKAEMNPLQLAVGPVTDQQFFILTVSLSPGLLFYVK